MTTISPSCMALHEKWQAGHVIGQVGWLVRHWDIADSMLCPTRLEAL
jgi:hypothetical protein